MNYKIITRRAKTSSIIAILIAAASLVLCFLNNVSLSFVGLTIFAVAIIWFFAGCKEQIILPERISVKKEEKIYKNEELQKLRNIFATKDFKQLDTLKSENYGGCKVCRWSSKDGKNVYLQLFVYVPHTYRADTEIIKVE